MRTFERLCLDRFVEEVEKRAENLSPLAKECLCLLATFEREIFSESYYPDSGFSLKLHRFQKIYTSLLQREINEKTLRRALEELVISGFLYPHHRDEYIVPGFLDVLLERIRRLLPRVE